MQKRLQQITAAYNNLNSLSKNQALNSSHLDQILAMKKYYYHNLKGLDKQVKKMDLPDRKRYNDFDKNLV